MLELFSIIVVIIIVFHDLICLIIFSSDGVETGGVYRFRTPLWRILRPDEDPEVGLTAKDPQADKDVISHVNSGSRENYRSQFISTFASYDAAQERMAKDKGQGLTRLRIAKIEPNALPESWKLEIVDLTTEENRDKHLKNSNRIKSYARKSFEVLLVCNVPIPCHAVDPLKLWRLLRPDEDPVVGLTAKDPQASKTVFSHVHCEDQKGYRSQYISTTASYAAAAQDYKAKKENKGLTGLRIAKIDLDTLRKPYELELVDLRSSENQDKYLKGAPKCKNIAKASCKVLLKCNVPIPCHVIDPPE